MQYAITGIILYGICMSYYYGIGNGYETRDAREKIAYILYNYELQEDEQLKKLYPDIKYVKQYAPILKKYNYNVFHR